MKVDASTTVTTQTVLVNTFFITVILCYLYTFMEWLFLVSKPSFLANWAVVDSVSILTLVPLPFVFIALLLFLIFKTGLLLVPDRGFSLFFPVVYLTIPSIILTALVFLLVENFTYTLFGFAVGSFTGFTRHLYLLAIILFAIWVGRKLHGLVKMQIWETQAKYLKRAVIAVLLIAMALCVTRLALIEKVQWDGAMAENPELVNILVLSTDGLDASHMSAYGYHRSTSPFIQSLIPQSLIVMNHFTNNTKSTGSIGALFSGKLPTTTRVIYPPDIFQGLDVFQHMPGLLKALGYHNADFSIRHYTDPYDLNMREGFDQANGREFSKISNHFELPVRIKSAFVKESYFLEVISNRLLERAGHVMSIIDMVNPYLLVTDLNDAQRHFPDSKRIDQLIDFIDGSNDPFFAHVHLMGTHGPKFSPISKVHSLGKKQTDNWMDDFYDDVILDYDQTVQKVFSHLEKNGLLEKTLIILTSDHGAKWKATERIPLIMRFPHQQHAGVRNNNIQRIDVTASIVDYLGIEKPGWMEGESFLGGELDSIRPIFFANSIAWGPKNSAGWRDVSSYDPPYYSLGGVGVILAQNWHYWDLSKNKIRSGKIKNHSAPIPGKNLPQNDKALDLIAGHLKAKRYPVPQVNK